MTEIQLTNIQFAKLQLDNLVAKDKPYIESWSALIFVFFLIPIGLELGLRLLVALFEEDEVLGCVALVVILVVLMIIIF